MAFPMDSLLVCVVLIDLALLAVNRLVTLVRIAALQGVLIGGLSLYVGGADAASILTATASLVLKGIVFPFMLMRAMREASINREVEPYIGLNLSIIFGLALLALSLWLGFKLPLPVAAASTLIVPVALFTILAGLFLIVGRLKARIAERSASGLIAAPSTVGLAASASKAFTASSRAASAAVSESGSFVATASRSSCWIRASASSRSRLRSAAG